MCWNHRVVKKICPYTGEAIYEIREAYYFNDKHESKQNISDDEIPSSYTINAIAPMGETIDDLKWVLNKMLEACDKPVIVDNEEK